MPVLPTPRLARLLAALSGTQSGLAYRLYRAAHGPVQSRPCTRMARDLAARSHWLGRARHALSSARGGGT